MLLTKNNIMKKIIFSSLVVAGLFVSLSSFAAPGFGRGGWGGRVACGYRGGFVSHPGFGFHTGFGYGAPRVYVNPLPAPVIYGPAYPVVYNTVPNYYGHAYYGHGFYRRPVCRRW
jgi:hypothetical protein